MLDPESDPAALARAAGGDYVVTASLEQEGGVELLVLKVIDADSGELYWSGSVRGSGVTPRRYVRD